MGKKARIKKERKQTVIFPEKKNRKAIAISLFLVLFLIGIFGYRVWQKNKVLLPVKVKDFSYQATGIQLDFTRVLPKIEKDLRHLSMPEADAVIQFLPEFMKTLEIFSDRDFLKKIHLDVVFSVHFDQGMSKEEEALVRSSQASVYKFLQVQSQKYSDMLVGFEGSVLEKFSGEGYSQEIWERYGKNAGMSVVEINREVCSKSALETDGTWRFLHETDKPGIGIENEALLTLHFRVLEKIRYGYEQEYLSSFSQGLSMLRSHLAVARMLQKMRDQKITYGVLPYGYLHRPDLESFFAAIKISSTLWVTS